MSGCARFVEHAELNVLEKHQKKYVESKIPPFKGQHVEYRDGASMPFRKATPAEIAPRKKLYLKIEKARRRVARAKFEYEQLIKKCDCLIFVDTPGFPYDVRNCAVCGAGKGLI